MMMNKIEIIGDRLFAYSKPFCFAWSGGRFCIMNGKQQLVDFGDGGLSRYDENYPVQKVKHKMLGDFIADNTKFTFLDHNVEFDFKELNNCHWLDMNKAKGKEKYESTVIHHLRRLSIKKATL